MQPKTRDNLIYLGVGLGIVGLLVVDMFYTDSHGSKLWRPSRFALRTIIYTGILGYFVGRETKRVKATLPQMAMCIAFASMLQLIVAFALRQTFSARFSGTLWILAVLEMFVITQLMVWVVQYLRHNSHRA
jgi:hypothetical protein